MVGVSASFFSHHFFPLMAFILPRNIWKNTIATLYQLENGQSLVKMSFQYISVELGCLKTWEFRIWHRGYRPEWHNSKLLHLRTWWANAISPHLCTLQRHLGEKWKQLHVSFQFFWNMKGQKILATPAPSCNSPYSNCNFAKIGGIRDLKPPVTCGIRCFPGWRSISCVSCFWSTWWNLEQLCPHPVGMGWQESSHLLLLKLPKSHRGGCSHLTPSLPAGGSLDLVGCSGCIRLPKHDLFGNSQWWCNYGRMPSNVLSGRMTKKKGQIESSICFWNSLWKN